MNTKDIITSSIGYCKILHLLYENNVCLRCILRLYKIESIDLYRNNEYFIEILNIVSEKLKLGTNLLNEYDFLNNIIKSINSHEKNICVLCLGILQFQDKEENLKNLVEKIKKEDFEFNSFKLTLKVPLSTTIRSYQMICFAEKKLKDDIIDESEKHFFEKWKENYIDVKVGFKWILGPQLSKCLNCDAKTDDKFCINLTYKNEEDEKDYFTRFHKVLSLIHEEDYEKKMNKKKIKYDKNQMPKARTESSQNNLEKILSLQKDYFYSMLESQPPKKIKNDFELSVNCTYQNIYIMGNYQKYSRIISQTPWLVDDKMMYESSIQEEIAKIIKVYFKVENYKFHSGGREDIDVRMLGNGRPFVLELIDPKRAISVQESHLTEMETKINMSIDVKVNNLIFSNEKCFEILKQYESAKIKAYVCLVKTEKELNEKDINIINNSPSLKINQKTPMRVLHRRTLMIREKFIYKMNAFKINSKFMILYMLASAGTYIKEFVHGDLERTLPNLGTIIENETDILQLDVLKLYEKLDNDVLLDFIKSSSPPTELKL